MVSQKEPEVQLLGCFYVVVVVVVGGGGGGGGRGVEYFNGTSMFKAKFCVLHIHDACDTESYCSTPYLPCRSEKLRRSDSISSENKLELCAFCKV